MRTSLASPSLSSFSLTWTSPTARSSTKTERLRTSSSRSSSSPWSSRTCTTKWARQSQAPNASQSNSRTSSMEHLSRWTRSSTKFTNCSRTRFCTRVRPTIRRRSTSEKRWTRHYPIVSGNSRKSKSSSERRTRSTGRSWPRICSRASMRYNLTHHLRRKSKSRTYSLTRRPSKSRKSFRIWRIWISMRAKTTESPKTARGLSQAPERIQSRSIRWKRSSLQQSRLIRRATWWRIS